MTQQQLSQKYTPEIAKEIVQSKMQPEFSHQRKPHPDLPSRKESYQYERFEDSESISVSEPL